jgi:hypothetical protein
MTRIALIRVNHCRHGLYNLSHTLPQQMLLELVFDGCSSLQLSVRIVSDQFGFSVRELTIQPPTESGPINMGSPAVIRPELMMPLTTTPV